MDKEAAFEQFSDVPQPCNIEDEVGNKRDVAILVSFVKQPSDYH